MRKELAKINNKRDRFTGVFERYGSKSNWHGFPETTVLLTKIRLKDKIVTDHLWFKLTKGFQKLGNLNQGDIISFEARVMPYMKGYVSNSDFEYSTKEMDYRLSHPTKFSISTFADKTLFSEQHLT